MLSQAKRGIKHLIEQFRSTCHAAIYNLCRECLTLRQALPSKNNRTEILKIVVDANELIDKHDIVNSLNEYFTTIASSLLASQQPHGSPVDVQKDGPLPISNHLFKLHAVSENVVFKVLRTMDISKATGADSIPAKVIRTAAPYISNVVANLFNASFQCGGFPSIWKTARVTPLFYSKVGRHFVNNRTRLCYFLLACSQ